jgi:hypothetical protein
MKEIYRFIRFGSVLNIDHSRWLVESSFLCTRECHQSSTQVHLVAVQCPSLATGCWRISLLYVFPLFLTLSKRYEGNIALVETCASLREIDIGHIAASITWWHSVPSSVAVVLVDSINKSTIWSHGYELPELAVLFDLYSRASASSWIIFYVDQTFIPSERPRVHTTPLMHEYIYDNLAHRHSYYVLSLLCDRYNILGRLIYCRILPLYIVCCTISSAWRGFSGISFGGLSAPVSGREPLRNGAWISGENFVCFQWSFFVPVVPHEQLGENIVSLCRTRVCYAYSTPKKRFGILFKDVKVW